MNGRVGNSRDFQENAETGNLGIREGIAGLGFISARCVIRRGCSSQGRGEFNGRFLTAQAGTTGRKESDLVGGKKWWGSSNGEGPSTIEVRGAEKNV